MAIYAAEHQASVCKEAIDARERLFPTFGGHSATPSEEARRGLYNHTRITHKTAVIKSLTPINRQTRCNYWLVDFYSENRHFGNS